MRGANHESVSSNHRDSDGSKFVINISEMVQKGRVIKKDEYRIPNIVKGKGDR